MDKWTACAVRRPQGLPWTTRALPTAPRSAHCSTARDHHGNGQRAIAPDPRSRGWADLNEMAAETLGIANIGGRRYLT